MVMFLYFLTHDFLHTFTQFEKNLSIKVVEKLCSGERSRKPKNKIQHGMNKSLKGSFTYEQA